MPQGRLNLPLIWLVHPTDSSFCFQRPCVIISLIVLGFPPVSSSGEEFEEVERKVEEEGRRRLGKIPVRQPVTFEISHCPSYET